jgi:apolipoprotein N-acyltransferase
LPIGRARLGILLCYQSMIPARAAELAHRGATVLVNLTNDGWFGRSAASRQGVAHAVFRAIQQRLPVVRVANAGVSAVVEPTGRLVWVSRPHAFVTHTAEVAWRAPPTDLTPSASPSRTSR